MERAGDVMTTPAPLLWLGDNFPLWLLLIVVALLATGRKLLRRNRDY